MYDDLIKKLRADKISLDELICILHEAADAIEELSSAGSIYGKAWALGYDAGRDENTPRWISVTERLPEPNSVDKHGFAKGYLVKTDRHVMMHTARYNGKWWIIWGKPEVIADTVTHWMPLPEPPKEE